MASSSSNNGSNSKGDGGERSSLLVIIVDVSPTTWGKRELKRVANDQARFAAGKRSVGPATLQDCCTSLQALCGAFASLEHHSALLVIAVASNETAVVYPRKDNLHEFFQQYQNGQSTTCDTTTFKQDLIVGTGELVARVAAKAERAAAAAEAVENFATPTSDASIAAALSLALCSINRFLVASNVGVSALRSPMDSSSSVQAWTRQEKDVGIWSFLGDTTGSTKQDQSIKLLPTWSPRILIIQASTDQSRNYNAIMNCAFAACAQKIVIDGCYISSGITGDDKSSAFLEQVCDLTGGIYLAPSGAAQVGGALTEVMLSVFLAPVPARPFLNLPAINKVDFRARAFDTGETVDMAHVCNLCLSIFKVQPKQYCPTCGAEIKSSTRKH